MKQHDTISNFCAADLPIGFTIQIKPGDTWIVVRCAIGKAWRKCSDYNTCQILCSFTTTISDDDNRDDDNLIQQHVKTDEVISKPSRGRPCKKITTKKNTKPLTAFQLFVQQFMGSFVFSENINSREKLKICCTHWKQYKLRNGSATT
jgi:hypothetical protein